MSQTNEQGMSAAQAAFAEYFVKNYPGPHTVISDPNWHAPKLFRAAMRAMNDAGLLAEAQPLLPSAADEPKPFAWALRIGDSDMWGFGREEWQVDFDGKRSGTKYEKVALFTRPASARPSAGVGEAFGLESYKRMFAAACESLGAISEALGLDPNDDPDCILDAIEELKSAAPVAPAAEVDVIGTLALAYRDAATLSGPDDAPKEACRLLRLIGNAYYGLTGRNPELSP